MSDHVVIAYEFTLELPPSLNRYWRKCGERIVVSNAARAYRMRAGWQARAAGCYPLAGPVGLELHVHRARLVGDLDNYLKVLLDALQGVLYEDDKQVVVLCAFRHDDPANPRVDVKAWQTDP